MTVAPVALPCGAHDTVPVVCVEVPMLTRKVFS